MTEAVITEEIIESKSFDYDSFKVRTQELLDEGQPTSGDAEEMPDLLEFTKLNLKRMERIPKQVELNHALVEKLLMLPDHLYWVVFVEGWCGDVAQNLPVLHQMAEATGKVDLKLLWRDQNPNMMDSYLTNGGKSIPKLVAIRSSDHQELGTWGPRPRPVQEEILKIKDEYSDRPKKEMVEALHKRMHKWYAEDKGKTLQEEFITLLEEWTQKLEEHPSH